MSSTRAFDGILQGGVNRSHGPPPATFSKAVGSPLSSGGVAVPVATARPLIVTRAATSQGAPSCFPSAAAFPPLPPPVQRAQVITNSCNPTRPFPPSPPLHQQQQFAPALPQVKTKAVPDVHCNHGGAGVECDPIMNQVDAEIQEVDFRRQLEALNPSATLSVELPFQGNGYLYQVRTTVSGLVFYGRALTEEEAVLKCCKKAVGHISMNYDKNSNCPREVNRETPAPETPAAAASAVPSRPTATQSRRPDRRQRPVAPPPPPSTYHPVGPGANNRRVERERELRSEMGNVMAMLDRRCTRGPGARPEASSSHGGVGDSNRRQAKDKPDSSPSKDRKGKKSGGSKKAAAKAAAKVASKVQVASAKTEAATSDIASSLSASSTNAPDTDSVDERDSITTSTASSLINSLGPSVNLKSIPIKNAVMMLNEMFPPPKAPQYKVTSQTGPPNNPTFTMVCTIEDQNFAGEGKSKKEAKLSCSQKAIEAICGAAINETKYVSEQSNPRASCDLDDWMELEGKNPVSILNELYPGIQYQLLSTSGPSHAPNFIIKASLNDMSAEGSGKSKKDAKLNASKALLVLLHKVGFDPMTGDMMSTQQDNDAVASGHSFADQIGQLVTNKYQALFGSTTYSKRRVMAGVVVTKDFGDVSNGEVVCVSSGTKCINGEQLSLEGCVINDSHAEIVTRRCLMVYLYKQLENICNNEESIFQPTPDTSAVFHYELKEGIGFHLFITTSPCGDARIFSLHENSNKDKPLEPATSVHSLNNAVEENSKDGSKPEDGVVNEEEEKTIDINSKDDATTEECQDQPKAVPIEHQLDRTLHQEKEDDSFTRAENEKSECQPTLDGNANELDGKNIVVNDGDSTSNIGGGGISDVDSALATTSQLDENKNEMKTEEDTVVIGNEDTPPIDDTPTKGGLVIPTITITDIDASEEEIAAKREKARERVKQTDSSKGMLRSKIECGMGTVPIGQKIHLQTWDGVMSADRLLTMACSDKILRWNVVGIQGALLTHLVKPVYLSSITVGSKFHPGHMKRALYERIEKHLCDLPRTFSLNVPNLYATTSPETRQATKAHDYSVNWVVESGQPEIVNGSTGKTINDTTSRLSKRSLFERFLKVSQQLIKEPFSRPARYSEVKALAIDYQEAKGQVTVALVKSGCGHWVEKPVEQDQFSL